MVSVEIFYHFKTYQVKNYFTFHTFTPGFLLKVVTIFYTLTLSLSLSLSLSLFLSLSLSLPPPPPPPPPVC